MTEPDGPLQDTPATIPGEQASDLGPYALAPKWVIYLPVSDRALRLWLILAERANRDRVAWPSRRTLADLLRCSPDSIDRARAELVAAGALDYEPRTRADGGQTSNLYRVRYLPDTAPARPPLRTGAAPPLSTDAAPTTLKEYPVGTSMGEDTPTRTDADTTDPREAAVEASADALQAFNAAAGGTRYTNLGWGERIRAALRSTPDLTREDVHAVIAHHFTNPWWAKAPNPGVLWGSPGQWERCVEEWRAAPSAPAARAGREEVGEDGLAAWERNALQAYRNTGDPAFLREVRVHGSPAARAAAGEGGEA